MGLLVGEAFKDSVYVYDTATGAPEIAAAVTCVVIDQLGNRDHPAGAAVVEEGLGWYSCTWTPDAAGTWKTEWGCPAGMTIAYPFKEFHVGAGQEAGILADTNELQTDWENGGRLDLLLDEAINDAVVIDGKVDVIDNFVDDLETRLTAARAGYIDKIANHLVTRTWFSDTDDSITCNTDSSDLTLPSVVLPNITGTIVHAYAGIKFRMIENTAGGGTNGLNGVQDIQVKESVGGVYTDAINLADNQWLVAASTREGGDVVIGDIDIVAQVAAFNKTYNFIIDNNDVDLASLVLNDVQTFLIVSYY